MQYYYVSVEYKYSTNMDML